MEYEWILPGPCQPVKFEDNMPVYTIDQIEIFGEPCNWGVCAYLVTSSRDNQWTYASDWKFEQDRLGSLRPIHRYVRQKRFEYTLYQLLGFRGTVPLELISDLRKYGYDPRPTHVWESIRGFIKQSEYGNVYYNRIPSIMHMIGLRMRINVNNDDGDFIEEIVDEFRLVNARFDRLKNKPKYFPNMRFIALKFLHSFGARFDFHIPLIRTKRKLKPLESIWDTIALETESARVIGKSQNWINILTPKKYDQGSKSGVS